MSSQLLPKTVSQFGSKEYWNQFFRTRDSFEWYGQFDQLWPKLKKYIKISSDHILVIGCGNSSLSADLYDAGIVNNMSIDISDIVIDQMNRKYADDGKRNGIKFIKMDMLNMTFDDNHFNVVIDKGSLDAIATDESELCREKVESMFSEISRVLKPYGRFICVSLLQMHILRQLLNWFASNGNWLLRIQRCHESEAFNSDSDDNLTLPVFVIICTKLLKSGEKSETIFEVALSEDVDAKSKRLSSHEEVINEIESLQQYAFIQHRIKHFKIDDDFYLDLYDSVDSINPRYKLYFVEYKHRRSASKSSKYAVFVVPQGRECEWLFTTSEGRLELTKQTGYEKLIIVHLNRNHHYADLEIIKSELSNKVLELIPKKVLKGDHQIPFLSIGGNDVGKRTVLFRGNSEFSGDYVIEEITVNNSEIYRRLIFLGSQNIIQSEAKLKLIKKGKKHIRVIDHKYLSCKHHEIIVSGLTFLPSQDLINDCNLLIVGLGGGCLPTYIDHNFTSKNKNISLNIDVIEIDNSMLEMSKQWFELRAHNQSDNVKINVHIDDGIDFIYKTAQMNVYNSIILDVDSKNPSAGMSCPPEAFVDIDFLKRIKYLLSNRNGLFILNLVSRSQSKKKEVYQRIKSVFQKVFMVKIEDDLNEVIFASDSDTDPNWFKESDNQYNNSDLLNHNLYIDQLKNCYKTLRSQRKVL